MYWKQFAALLISLIAVAGCVREPARFVPFETVPLGYTLCGRSPVLGWAEEYAGFKATAPLGYWYEDMREITNPRKSFGLCSLQGNQKILFIICDDPLPLDDVTNFALHPPYSGIHAPDVESVFVDEGFSALGDRKFHWFLGRYHRTNPSAKCQFENILVGVYQSLVRGKSIVVVGRSLNDSSGDPYNYKTTLRLCDEMIISQHHIQDDAFRPKYVPRYCLHSHR